MSFITTPDKLPKELAERVLLANQQWDNDDYPDFGNLKNDLLRWMTPQVRPYVKGSYNVLPATSDEYNMRVASCTGIALCPKQDAKVWYIFNGETGQVIFGEETGKCVGGYPTDVPFVVLIHMIFGGPVGKK